MSIHATDLGPPSAPSANGTATIFDTTANPGTGTTLSRRSTLNVDRIMVTVFADQNLTYKVDQISAGATDSWHNVLSEPVPAGTFYEKDFPLTGRDFKAYLTAGAAAPSTFEVTARLVTGDRAST